MLPTSIPSRSTEAVLGAANTVPRSAHPAPSGGPRFLTVATVANALGLSPMTLYRAISAQQFPAVKVRGRYVVPARVLEEMEDAALLTGRVVNAAEWADDLDLGRAPTPVAAPAHVRANGA